MSQADSDPYRCRPLIMMQPLSSEEAITAERSLAGLSIPREALNPEVREYKAGRALKNLASMLASGDEEI